MKKCPNVQFWLFDLNTLSEYTGVCLGKGLPKYLSQLSIKFKQQHGRELVMPFVSKRTGCLVFTQEQLSHKRDVENIVAVYFYHVGKGKTVLLPSMKGKLKITYKLDEELHPKPLDQLVATPAFFYPEELAEELLWLSKVVPKLNEVDRSDENALAEIFKNRQKYLNAFKGNIKLRSSSLTHEPPSGKPAFFSKNAKHDANPNKPLLAKKKPQATCFSCLRFN